MPSKRHGDKNSFHRSSYCILTCSNVLSTFCNSAPCTVPPSDSLRLRSVIGRVPKRKIGEEFGGEMAIVSTPLDKIFCCSMKAVILTMPYYFISSHEATILDMPLIVPPFMPSANEKLRFCASTEKVACR